MSLTGQTTAQRVPPYVSDKLRKFAKGQECTLMMPWCLRAPETVVLCHIRRFGMGGMAGKPHDFFAFHGCSECHRREGEADDADLLRAMMLTQSRVYAQFGTLTP